MSAFTSACKGAVGVIQTALFFFLISSASAIEDIPEGEELWIRGDSQVGHANLVTDGFQNFGTIRLESRDGGWSSDLSVTSGSLSNGESGRIVVNPGTGGGRTIWANLINRGELELNYGLGLRKDGARYENYGTITIQGGHGLFIGGLGPVFHQNQGVIHVHGWLEANGVEFVLNGGTILGDAWLRNGSLRIGTEAVGAAGFILSGDAVRLYGQAQGEHRIVIRGDARMGHAVVRAPEGFGNNGLVRLDSGDGGWGTTLVADSPGFLNGAGGVVLIHPGTGGARTWAADLVNEGQFRVLTGARFERDGGTYRNRGQLEIASGQTLSIDGRNQRFVQEDGVFRVDGGLDVRSMGFEHLGGNIEGAVVLLDSSLHVEAPTAGAGQFILTGTSGRFSGGLNGAQVLFVRGNARGGHATVQAAGFANSGTIQLDSVDGGWSSALVMAEGQATNLIGGKILLQAGTGGGRVWAADLMNLGRFEVNRQARFDRLGGVYENAGEVQVSEGHTLHIHHKDQTFIQSGGTLSIAGVLDLVETRFVFRGGEVDGVAHLLNSQLLIEESAKGLGKFVLSGDRGRLWGTMQRGQTVSVRGSGRGGHAVLTVPGEFASGGELRMESVDGGWWSTVAMPEGRWINLAGGVVEMNGGTGGGRVWAADLLNQGRFEVDAPTRMDRLNGVYENAGELRVSAGQTLQIHHKNQSFIQSAGVLSLGGQLDIIEGRFEFTGGRMEGAATLLKSALVVAPEATGEANFVLTGDASTMAGGLHGGQTIWVRGDGRGGHATARVEGEFRNAGLVRLESIDGGWSSALVAPDGVWVNEVQGVLALESGTGGSRAVYGEILNKGEIRVNTTATFNKAQAVLVNEGSIEVARGSSLRVEGGVVQRAGNLRLDNSVLVLPVAMLELEGGQLEGVGRVESTVVSAGRVRPWAGGALEITGLYDQGAGGVLEVELGGNGAVGQLRVLGTANLHGKLQVRLAADYVPVIGESMAILTAGRRTGAFSRLDLPVLEADRQWEVDYLPTGVVLRVTARAETVEEVQGTVTDHLGAKLADVKVSAVQHSYSGLRGEYFDNVDFSNLVEVRLDGPVDFLWRMNSPSEAMEPDEFSIRWTGWIVPRHSETYTFYTVSDDGVRLWIDDQLLIENWTDHGTTENSGSIALEAGRAYSIKMEFYERDSSAVAKLLWSSPSQAKEPVPASQLRPSTVEGIEHLASYSVVLSGRTDASGRYQLGLGAGKWHLQVDDLARLGFLDPASYPLQVPAGGAGPDFVVEPNDDYFKPDLVVAAVQGPEVARAGTEVELSWTVENVGTATAIGPWTDTLYLEREADGGSGLALGTFITEGPLAPGESLTRLARVILPGDFFGDGLISVRADSGGRVVELNEANNVQVRDQALRLTGADLVIVSVTAPADAFFGESIEIRWTVRNAGQARAEGHWLDAVYLSTGQPSSELHLLARQAAAVAPLDPGAVYEQSAVVTLPARPNTGGGNELQLLVVTDAGNQQPEVDQENNSAPPHLLSVALPPAADLVAGRVTAPASALAGGTVELSWSVGNAGEKAPNRPWLETITILSPDGGFHPALLEVLEFADAIASGTEVSRSVKIPLPGWVPAGPVRFQIDVDSRDELVEREERDNRSVTEISTKLMLGLAMEVSPDRLREGGTGEMAVTRNGSLSSALAVTLRVSLPEEIELAETLTIEAGQATARMPVKSRLDGVVDGAQHVALTASALGYLNGTASLTVEDADVPELGLAVEEPLITEGGMVGAIVMRSHHLDRAMDIQLRSSNPVQLRVPAVVRIPAGETFASVFLEAVEDTRPELVETYWVTAAAAGFADATAEMTVADNDIPTLHLVLPASAAGESAGVVSSMGAVVRSAASDRPLVVRLRSSLPETLWLPDFVTIPAGATTARFQLVLIDNDQADGSRTVQVDAEVVDQASGLILAAAETANLLVTDDDGPTLRLALDKVLVREGVTGAALGSVTRNTEPAEPLVVQLKSDRLGEAVLPGTILIPAGQRAASFAVDTVQDNLADGNQSVLLSATASGYNPGTASLIVSDIDLPDLSIGRVDVSAQGVTDEPVSVSYELANSGLSAFKGSSIQRIYISRDAALSADDVLMGELVVTAELQVGQRIQQSGMFRLPNRAGRYRVIVVTDADQRAIESLESNNVTVSQWVEVGAAYSAEVQVDVERALAGTPVALVGQAHFAQGAPAPFLPVTIHLTARGVHRTIAAITDGGGQFTATFEPLPGEGGSFVVGAAHPGELEAPVQDTFELVGIKFARPWVQESVVAFGSAAGAVEVLNLSDVPVSGLRVETIGSGALRAAVEFPENIPGGGSAVLQFTVTSTGAAQANETVRIRVSNSEGIAAELPVHVAVRALEPHLRVEPEAIRAGMVRGRSTPVSLEVSNPGGAETGPIRVILPEAGWIRVRSPNPLPSLAPGQRQVVELALLPGLDLPLGEYKGALVLSAEQVGVSVPFTIRHVSEAVGGLHITTVDERRYYSDPPENLAGARIVLRDPYTQQIVLQGESDQTGEFLAAEIPEGLYNFEVTAPKHDRTAGTLQIKPGEVNEKTYFLRTQTVNYKWTVEEIEVEDRTKIVLETVFEASVPAPVVTVDPPFIDLAAVQSNQEQIDLKITNHGLISVEDFALTFGDHPEWSLTPLVGDIGTLRAKSSITVPVIVKRLSAGLASGSGRQSLSLMSLQPSAAASGGSCSVQAGAGGFYICGPFNVAVWVPVPVFNASLDCLPKSSTSTSVSAPSWSTSVSVPYLGPPGGGPRGPETVYLYSSPPGLGGPDGSNCECDPAFFKRECLEGSAGLDIDLGKYAAAITAKLPSYLHLQGLPMKVTVEGQACTCCENDIKGIELTSLTAKATIGVEALLGLNPEAEGTLTIPNLGDVTFQASFEAGLKVEIEGSLEGTLKTDCHLKNPDLAVSGGITITPKGIVSGKVQLSPPEGVDWDIQGELSAEGVIETGGSITVNSDGSVKASLEPLKFSAKIEGIVTVGGEPFGVSHAYEKQLWPAAGVAPSIDSSPGGLDSTRFAELFGFDSVEAMAAAALGGSALNGSTSGAGAGGGGGTLLSVAGGIESGYSRDRLVIYEYRAPVEAKPMPAIHAPARAAGLLAVTSGAEESACAQVRLKIEQDAVMTRKAVGATLEITNDGATPLEDLNVTVTIYDQDGRLANDKFVLLQPELNGITRLDGGEGSAVSRELWELAANKVGSARWIILPRDNAAPESAVSYSVGGFFSYTTGGVPTSSVLVPGPVTVYPNAKLQLKYFHQRDVVSDDPFTPETEPAEPFSLAVMVENKGAGTARNFTITSAQPEIIENEKGLLIDFKILATEVAGKAMTPSLMADFGDVEPGEIKTGRWLLSSSLLGFFVDYRATFEHEDRLGGRETSLIDSVQIHEMIREVRAARAFDEEVPAFLVNDEKDDLSLPDRIHLGDGSVAPVSAVVTAVEATAPGPGNLAVPLRAEMPAGWSYLRIPDPAAGGYTLKRVVRSDGLELPLPENAWVSSYTFTKPGSRPIREPVLHLVDYQSTGLYTLEYELQAGLDTEPPSSAVLPLPEFSPASFAVAWDGSDAGDAGLATFDIYVSANGAAFVPWLQRTDRRAAIYEGTAGARYAFYSVAVDRAGNREASPMVPDAVTRASQVNERPVLSAIPDQTVLEDETWTWTAMASDPDGAANELRFALEPGAPSGLRVDPLRGVMEWATGEAHGGTVREVGVRVTDGGLPPMSDVTWFHLTVVEQNRAPVLASISDQQLNPAQGEALRVQVIARDEDLPADSLTYALDPGAPVGSWIDAETGLLVWTPTLDQSPSTHQFVVRVTDNGSPPASATTSFVVAVKAVNSPPAIDPLPDRLEQVGALVEFAIAARDTDIPTQTLTFELESSRQTTAAVDFRTGEFRWLPGLEDGYTTNVFTVKAVDNGNPPLESRRSFRIEVEDFVAVSLGSAVVEIGKSGSLPLSFQSGGPVTELELELKWPEEGPGLGELSLDDLADHVIIGAVTQNAGGAVLHLRSSQGWQGSDVLAHLPFGPVPEQAFNIVPLEVVKVRARTPRYEIREASVTGGEVVIVGGAPMLAAELLPGRGLRLTVFGKPGATAVVERIAALGAADAWQEWKQVTLEDYFETIEELLPNEGESYYRLRAVP